MSRRHVVSLPPREYILATVRTALAEDLGGGDVSAALIEAEARAQAVIIARSRAVLCGRAWVDAVFAQLGEVSANWHAADGELLAAGQPLCTLQGNARALLSGERTALNFLQTLSGTATVARRFADAVAGTAAKVLDTRKTLPGLRLAQKYAVRCGGCHNHRIGLFDAYLIKENHIAAAGGIAAALARARAAHPELLLEIETENLQQLQEAIDGGARRVLLDNFDLATLRAAVALAAGRVELEASGDITLDNIPEVAASGVDFISVGSLTKHVTAADLSMRFA